jgi:hypothetical protein
MTLSALTFTMNLSAMQQRRHAYYTGYSPLEKSSWRWYEMIILPMRQLGEAGLKDFFVYLSWAGIERGMRIHHEKDLERAVMGKDYDSVRRGKPTERMYKTLMERRAAEGWEGY